MAPGDTKGKRTEGPRKRTIGFIGLGIMGRPMAKNLLRAGYPLVVHDVTPGPVEELVSLGAQRGSSGADVASRSDVVITMLPDSPEVRQVLTGPQGVFEGVRPGTLIVDMSTISPTVSKEMAEMGSAKGLRVLDAPVSGGEAGAINATLSIMVGGEKEVVESAMELFQVLGQRITHAGGPGAGQLVKACNQVMVALNISAMAEAFVLARKAGIDLTLLHQALSAGLANSAVLERHGPRVIQRDFQPGFKIKLHHKDLNIALDAAKDLGVSLPLTALVRELYRALITSGEGELDHRGLLLLLERLAGL